MPISTELTRMAQNVGALNVDTNAIFEALRAKGVDVPPGATLGDVAEMIREIVVNLPTVTIGGREYPYVQIGNQLWLAENLDWKAPDITIGASDTSIYQRRANYYLDDEASYGINGTRYGLLYNWPAAMLINSLLTDGWRVPSNEDKGILSTFLGTGAGTKLKSTSGWDNSGNGTNDYGFNGIPSGYRQSDYLGINTTSVYWTSTQIATQDSYEFGLASNIQYIGGGWGTNHGYQFSIRLVKDAPGFVTIGGRQYKTVTIGNQEWLAENLDYKFQVNGSQIPIGVSGNPTTPAAWYYDNNDATYGIDGTYKCGLLYNWYAAKYLDDNKSALLPSGWHVPSKSDWDTLATEIGGASTAGTKLKALDDSVISGFPSGWNGTDEYGFNAIPSGYEYNGTSYNFGVNINIQALTEVDSNNSYYISIGRGSSDIYTNNGTKTYGLSIRLVRTLS